MSVDFQTLKTLAEFLLSYAGGTLQNAVQSALTDEVKDRFNRIWSKVKCYFGKEPNPGDEKQVSEVVEILKKLVENGEIREEDIQYLHSFILNSTSYTSVNINASKTEKNIVKIDGNAEIKNSIVGENISIGELRVHRGKEDEEEKA